VTRIEELERRIADLEDALYQQRTRAGYEEHEKLDKEEAIANLLRQTGRWECHRLT
jgi:hypothetical protein